MDGDVKLERFLIVNPATQGQLDVLASTLSVTL